MIADWVPADHVRIAWHRRFPEIPLWAGRLRLWRVELAVRSEGTSSRRQFAFLDLPSCCVCVSDPTGPVEPWPDAVAAVPDEVLRPPDVEVVPFTDDWRTIPVVAAQAVRVLAVRHGDHTDVYRADADGTIGDQPDWVLPADALPVTGP